MWLRVQARGPPESPPRPVVKPRRGGRPPTPTATWRSTSPSRTNTHRGSSCDDRAHASPLVPAQRPRYRGARHGRRRRDRRLRRARPLGCPHRLRRGREPLRGALAAGRHRARPRHGRGGARRVLAVGVRARSRPPARRRSRRARLRRLEHRVPPRRRARRRGRWLDGDVRRRRRRGGRAGRPGRRRRGRAAGPRPGRRRRALRGRAPGRVARGPSRSAGGGARRRTGRPAARGGEPGGRARSRRRRGAGCRLGGDHRPHGW